MQAGEQASKLAGLLLPHVGAWWHAALLHELETEEEILTHTIQVLSFCAASWWCRQLEALSVVDWWLGHGHKLLATGAAAAVNSSPLPPFFCASTFASMLTM